MIRSPFKSIGITQKICFHIDFGFTSVPGEEFSLVLLNYMDSS